jgi:hypothetical protein
MRMRRYARRLMVAIATAVATLAWLASPGSSDSLASAAGQSPPLGGVNMTGLAFGSSQARVDQAVAWAHSVDAHVIRVEFPWSALEPRRGHVDQSALAYTDYLVNRAAAARIKVLVLAMGTPCWASSAPRSLLAKCRPGEQDGASAWAPRVPSVYGSFVAFLAARYKSKLAAIEVWNEPDQANEDYLAGPNKAQHYAEILRAAYPAIKRVDPNMTVLGGSLVGSNGAFLKALYAAGIKGYYDGLSVHFYNLVLASLRYTHEVQLQNGDTTPLWLNEFGWSSCWPRQRIQQEQACVTPRVQAANLANTYRSLARTRWVAAEVMYGLQGSRREDFGVLSETGARKSSFAALRSVLISPFGAPSPVTIRLNLRSGRVIATGSGPVGDYLQIEAAGSGGIRYRAQFTLNRFNGYSIALPKALGTSGLKVSVFQYWMGTAKAATAGI